MNRLMVAALLPFVMAATPAMAATYDIADFGGAFSYAQYDGASGFTAFTTPCGYGVGGCLAGPEGAGNSQVVYDAGDFLLAHPGTGAAPTAVIFTAPTTSSYVINGSAFLADTSANAGSGNGVALSGYRNGVAFPFATLSGPGDSRSLSGFTVALNAGDQLALLIGNNGNNSYDSVGLRGTIAAVPEPATWAMMIGGIGLAGGAMRRRRSATVRVAYA